MWRVRGSVVHDKINDGLTAWSTTQQGDESMWRGWKPCTARRELNASWNYCEWSLSADEQQRPSVREPSRTRPNDLMRAGWTNRATARRDFTALGVARTHAHAHEKIERVRTARGKRRRKRPSEPEASCSGAPAMGERRQDSRGGRANCRERRPRAGFYPMLKRLMKK
jgi:hypothetical protein